MNATNRKGLRLYAASFLLSSLLGATNSPAVELVLLVDASQLEARGNKKRAQEFFNDLLTHLPPHVGIRAFQFGGSSDLIPCAPISECLRETPEVAGGGLTLRQALLKVEDLLCPQDAAQEFPGRVIVAVSGNTGETRLTLASPCRINLIAVTLSSQKDDPALRELAMETQGAYGLLGKIRGYTVASLIKKKVWFPSVQRALEQGKGDPGEDSHILWLGSGLAALLALSITAFWRFITFHKKAIPPKAWPRPAEPEPVREARLKISSGAGSGGTFTFSCQQPVILGGKQHAPSPAHLLIDDPQVAGEHCQIYVEGSSFFADDLGSGQGTFVNDEPIAGRKALAPGDMLRIGGTTFELLRSDTAPQPR